jgi:DNA-binding transcriptional MerR regulator
MHEAAPGRTVGQVAAAVGVTVRPLHHYDEIGLLSPGLRTVPTLMSRNACGGNRPFSRHDSTRLADYSLQ